MLKPNESLDDYRVKSALDSNSEPPRPVTLHATGEVEMLEPLAHCEAQSSVVRKFSETSALRQIWFRRLIVVGSGALVMIALVLVSAILIGINEESKGSAIATNAASADALTEYDAATNAESTGSLTVPDESINVDTFTRATTAPTIDESDVVRRRIKRVVRTKINFVTRKPRRLSRPLPQHTKAKFVPTTLVIYAENGVINTRVEPWLQAGYKKQTF